MGRSASVLVLDDGELDDVHDILQDVGVSFGHVRGEAIAPGTPPPRDLLVSTPRRVGAVAELPSKVYGREPVRIVVVDEDSVTLRSQLRRLGFDYLVRRPVHPEALRLLVLRCLYSGRERRREPRVPIGCEVSFRAGVLPHKATLADLSTGGCRLLSPHRVPAGRRIQLQVRVAAGEADGSEGATEARDAATVQIPGRVVRSGLEPHLELEDVHTAAVRFEDLSERARAAIDAILVERAAGPATVEEPAATGEAPPVPAPVPPEQRRAKRARLRPPAPPAPADDAVPAEPATPAPADADTQPEMVDATDDTPADRTAGPEAAEPPQAADLLGDEGVVDEVQRQRGGGLFDEEEDLPTDPTLDARLGAGGDGGDGRDGADAPTAEPEAPASERRRHRRAAYPRKVTGIGDRASRVLICRDLSEGGMRIEALPELELGDRLHLALYDDASGEPVLLWGEISRDDGEAGLAITFDAMPPERATRLEKLVAGLPSVESLGDDEAAAMGTVVGEILEG